MRQPIFRPDQEICTSELQNLTHELRLIQPLRGLGIPLDLLDGYATVTTLAVRMEAATRLPAIAIPFTEITGQETRGMVVRLFITPREDATTLRQALEAAGAQPVELPRGRPHATPAEEAARLINRATDIQRELFRLKQELAAVGARHRTFIFTAEEALKALLEKNRGTTYCGISGYALAVKFWVPERDLAEVGTAIRTRFPAGLAMQVDTEAEKIIEREDPDEQTRHPGVPAMAPTRLRNRAWARPFETLVEVFGVPRNSEIDPTTLMAISFPLFFGFMIGDLGYGAVITLAGLHVRRRAGAMAEPWLRDLAYCLALGGLCGLIFGAVVFGDCFGVPFHAETGFAWSRWVPFLPAALLEKGQATGVMEMLMLSIIAGWAHMTTGCVFGMVNQLHHSPRHALARLGQALMITGMALLVLHMEMMRATPLGALLWDGILGPLGTAGPAELIGLLIVASLGLTVVGEGPAALIEIFGLFGNVVSFARLALVGASKGGVAAALNTILIPALTAGGAAALLIPLAIVGLVTGHIMLILLGGLSASIQSIRLHYCEMFSKFFRGGGARFAPFGSARHYTKA